MIFVSRLKSFISKVSNLLLPFGTEGATGFESYATSEISNKYIYDAFFNGLFIYFVAVVFCTLKELIRNPQRLQFCNFVRLYEKSQEYISKRAVLEKQPFDS